jgi:hypothetical protein
MLTPQEEMELAELQSEAETLSQMEQQQSAPQAMPQAAAMPLVSQGLTPEEEMELAQLENEAIDLSGQEQTTSKLDKGLNLLMWAGEKFDQLSGSTTLRTGVSSILPAGETFGGKQIDPAKMAFAPQTKDAPVGRDIAVQAGVSDVPFSPSAADMPAEMMLTGLWSKKATEEQERMLSEKPKTKQELIQLQEEGAAFSPAEIIGAGLDLVLDPTNFVSPLKALGAGVKYGVKPVLKGTAYAADMVSGTKMVSDSLELGGTIAKKTRQFLNDIFKPTVARDAKTYFKIAKKHDIPIDILPERVEFGENSTISQIAQSLAELGGEKGAKWMDALARVDEAIDSKITKISGDVGVLDDLQAGLKIKEGVEAGRKRFFDSMDITYNRVLELAGGDMPISADSAKKMMNSFQEIEEKAGAAIRTGTIDTA